MAWKYSYTGDNPYIHYNISCSSKRESNSKIKYTINFTWRLDNSGSYLGTGYRLQVKATSSTGGDSGWIDYKSYSSSVSGTTVRTGPTITFTATSTTAGATDYVTLSFRNNSDYDPNYTSGSTKRAFSTPALLWTNCTAPTTVSFATGTGQIIAPSPTSSVTVKWSGAKNGTSNTISTYEIYYYFSSNGASPTTSLYSGIISVTASNTNTTILIKEENRGKYLKVAVRSVAPHNTSSLKVSDTSLQINKRPNVPTVSGSNIIIKSTDTSANITGIQPGSLNFGSQVSSVYYATSSSGTKTKVTGSTLSVTMPTNTSSKSLYFWTYDGLEYSSSSKQVTITRNTKPTINGSPKNEKFSTIKNLSTFPKTANALEEINFTLTANKTLKAKIQIIYNDKTYLLADAISLGTNSYTTSTYYIRELNLPLNTDFTFKITPYDNYETGDSLSISNNYRLPPLPIYIGHFNQLNDLNIAGTNSNNFYKNIRVRYSYDSYFCKKGEVLLVSGENNFSGTVQLKEQKTNGYMALDIIGVDSMVSGKAYNVAIKLSLNSNTSLKEFEMTKTPAIDPTPSSGSSFYVKPFTSGSNGDYSQDVIFSKGSLPDGYTENKFYSFYNLNKTSWWKSELLINNKSLDITNFISGFEISGDYIKRTFTINNDSFFNSLTGIITEETERRGIIRGSLKNTVTNLFGQVIFGQATNVTLDFEEETVYIPQANNLGTNTFLYEGYEISIPLQIKTYSVNNISFEVLIKREGDSSYTNYIGPEIINYETSNISFNNPREVTATLTTTVKEISDTRNCYFAIKILDGTKEIPTTWNSGIIYKRLKASAPILNLNKVDYQEGPPTATVYYSILDPGYDTAQLMEVQLPEKITISKGLSLSNDISEETKTSAIENNNQIFNLKGTIQDFKNSNLILTNILEYTLKDGNKITLTKTGTSNIYTIYGLSPTVSYRKNHLGINTNSFAESDIIKISPTSDRKLIRFKQVGTEYSICLDLGTGQLIGVNIDCGEITPSSEN